MNYLVVTPTILRACTDTYTPFGLTATEHVECWLEHTSPSAQLFCESQPKPAEHREHTLPASDEANPQSRPVSCPFTSPSSHVGYASAARRVSQLPFEFLIQPASQKH